MIWRLHWLEMRGGLVAALCVSLFAAAFNFSFVLSEAGLLEFVTHRGIFVAFFVAIMAGGDGLRGPITLRRHPWHLHKLALPIARRKLVVTKIIATASAAMFICTLVNAAYLAIALRRGAAIDWSSVAVAHLYSLSTAAAFTAALAALSVFFNVLLFALAALLVVAAAVANNSLIMTSMLEGGVAWAAIAVVAGVAAVGFSTAVIQGPRREIA